MKVAIMQPYFLPYIGYWNLIQAVDKFIILDDVNFIKGGWINRNKIIVGGKPFWMSIPLVGASQNKLIYELEILADNGWQQRMQKTVQEAYSNSGNHEKMMKIFNDWLLQAKGNLANFLLKTMLDVCQLLDITTDIIPSSRIFPKNGKKGEERILDICAKTNASSYYNLPGGSQLYSPVAFQRIGIELHLMELPQENLGKAQENSSQLSILHRLFTESNAGTI
jgi:hypothetical protein